MPSVALGTGAGASGVLLERAAELSMLGRSPGGGPSAARAGSVLLVGRRGRGGQDGARCGGSATSAADRRGSSGAPAIRCSRRVRSGRCSLSPRRPAASSRRSWRAGAMPHEVVAALARELRARAPTVFVLEDVHWADEATLDVLQAARPPGGDGAGPGRGQLPRRRARPRATRCGSCSASWRRARRSGGSSSSGSRRRRSRSSPSRTASTPTSSTARPPATRSSSSRRSPPAARGSRTRSGTRCSPAPRGSALRQRQLLEAVAVVAAAGRALAAGGACRRRRRRARRVPDVGHADVRAGGRGVPPRARPARRRGIGRAAPKARACIAGPWRRSRIHRAARPIWPGSRTTPRRPATSTRCCASRPRPAARAASLGAHREAAAQYARALRFGDRLPVAERAELLEGRAQRVLPDRSVRRRRSRRSSRRSSCRRQLGDGSQEGDALRRLSRDPLVPGPGRGSRARRPARRSRCSRRCRPAASSRGLREPRRWTAGARRARRRRSPGPSGPRARGAPRRHGDRRPRARHDRRAASRGLAGGKLERSLELALRAGLAEQVGRRHSCSSSIGGRGSAATAWRARYLQAGIDYCSDQGLELYRLYLLAYRARLELDQGRWAGGRPTPPRPSCASPAPRSGRASSRSWCSGWCARGAATRASGRCWTRRGRWRSRPKSCRDSAPVAAARAEAAWLEGDRDAVNEATEGVARARPASGSAGGWPASWPSGAGAPASTASPRPRRRSHTRCSSPASWAQAAELWRELGCPYEAALALADADEEAPLRRALEELRAAGCARRPPRSSPGACASAARGGCRAARAGRRGEPGRAHRRASSRCWRCSAEGLRNAEIAERLVLSEQDGRPPRLGDPAQARRPVAARGRRAAAAVRLGLSRPEDRDQAAPTWVVAPMCPAGPARHS